jgi:DNA-binding PadR family transcriptional regulator
MVRQVNLGELEHLTLLAILRIPDGAYGVPIREEIRRCTNRKVSAGALYTILSRLEDKGLVRSSFGDPTPERGGRPKRYYRVTSQGVAAVKATQRNLQNLMRGLRLSEL